MKAVATFIFLGVWLLNLKILLKEFPSMRNQQNMYTISGRKILYPSLKLRQLIFTGVIIHYIIQQLVNAIRFVLQKYRKSICSRNYKRRIRSSNIWRIAERSDFN